MGVDPTTGALDAAAQAERDAEAIRNIDAMRNIEAMKERAAAEAVQATTAAEPAAPEAAPAPAPAPEPELRTHTVAKGDTLSGIGKKFGVKWRAIAELNGVANPDRIFPGQVFKIPNS